MTALEGHQQCYDECVNHNQCVGWTYTNSDNPRPNRCFIKTSNADCNDAENFDSANLQQWTVKMDQDCPGSDLPDTWDNSDHGTTAPGGHKQCYDLCLGRFSN